MSKLEKSIDRFFSSLERLEAACESRGEVNGWGDSDAAAEIAALKEDRVQLQAELEDARSHNHALEQTAEELTGRLDHAIGELRDTLEG